MEMKSTYIFNYDIDLEAYIAYYLDYTEDIVPYIDIYFAKDISQIDENKLNWIGITKINIDTFLRLLKAYSGRLSKISSTIIEKVNEEEDEDEEYVSNIDDLEDEAINKSLDEAGIEAANISNFTYLQNFFSQNDGKEIININID